MADNISLTSFEPEKHMKKGSYSLKDCSPTASSFNMSKAVPISGLMNLKQAKIDYITRSKHNKNHMKDQDLSENQNESNALSPSMSYHLTS